MRAELAFSPHSSSFVVVFQHLFSEVKTGPEEWLDPVTSLEEVNRQSLGQLWWNLYKPKETQIQK